MIDTTTVAAEDAPIGQLLWAVVAPKFAPNFTLREVQVIRNETGSYVRWIYEGGSERTFKLGERVVIMAGYSVTTV